ncbi:MAG: type I-C CRISPR-associated protein Cas8c/Csd1 [Clostridiales bacterium]|jgi:CRISPR-associated protein Csd1|nr:type I-C CRISPR-associated protein Cas8c/Csd1 [Clostridiales bacterium]
MILQALTRYYALMDEARDTLDEWNQMPPLWFAHAKISYGLCLKEDGTLTQILPLKVETQANKKTAEIPQSMTLPMPYVRSANIVANYLCDNALFLLGYDYKGDTKRTSECFADSKKLHQEILRGIDCPAARAVYAYFDRYNPQTPHPTLSDPALIAEMKAGRYFLFIAPDGTYAHDDIKLQEAWVRYKNAQLSSTRMQCLVTGEADEPIAPLHPKIKGVRNAQSSGASLVSFNASAYESYGLSSSINAPVSEYAAFAYATALNYLLSRPSHHASLADTSIVYWAEDANPAYVDYFSAVFSPQENQNALLDSIMEKVARGLPIAGEGLDSGTPFCVLGLAPNAARIAVRFFLQDTFGNMLSNIVSHYKRLEIAKAPYEPNHVTPYRLLKETVHPMSKDNASSPLLAGAVLKAILSDTNYPEALMQNVLLRVRAEHSISRGKAAILKAYLLQNQGNDPKTKEVAQVSLQEDCTVLPYVLGRLFAALEFVQADSLKQDDRKQDIGANIKKKFFSSACDTPALIFNELLKQYPVYLNRMKSESRRIFYSNLVLDLMGKLPAPNEADAFPARLSNTEQCRFLLGYHHQSQRFYQKRPAASGEAAPEAPAVNEQQSTESEEGYHG